MFILKTVDAEAEKKKVMRLYQKYGCKNIFFQDVLSLICLSDTNEDMDFLMKVVKEICAHDLRSPNVLSSCLGLFLDLCHINRDWPRAQEVFKDPAAKKRLKKGTRNVYYNLMYDQEKYDDIIEELSKSSERLPFEEQFLYMAALNRIGTKEAFDAATKTMEGEFTDKSIFSCHMYALFALNQGELAQAYDSISKSLAAHKNSLSLKTLMLLTLVKYGRLEEALKSLEDRLKDDNKERPVKVPYEVLKHLADSVKASRDQMLVSRFTELCNEFESKGCIMDISVEELLKNEKRNNFSA